MSPEPMLVNGPVTQDTVQVAIETTGRQGSIAVLRGEIVLMQTRLEGDARSAAILAPRLQQTLRWCQDQGQVPDFVSVASGPGSFTGLRIGVTTAKTLSYASRLPLIAVDSLAAIAALVLDEDPSVDRIWVALDAYRGQVFAGQFERNELLPPLTGLPDRWNAEPTTVRVLVRQAWQTILAGRGAGTGLAGDEKAFPGIAPTQLTIRSSCDAVGVGLVALCAARGNQWCDPMALVPRYLRPSAAEEKAASSI